MKLIVVRRSADFMVHLGKDSRIWECGATIAEALGKWVLTHGEDNDIEIVRPPAPKWNRYAGIDTLESKHTTPEMPLTFPPDNCLDNPAKLDILSLLRW